MALTEKFDNAEVGVMVRCFLPILVIGVFDFIEKTSADCCLLQGTGFVAASPSRL